MFAGFVGSVPSSFKSKLILFFFFLPFTQREIVFACFLTVSLISAVLLYSKKLSIRKLHSWYNLR